MSLLGKTVGHIRVKAFIGRGGMGEVYEGFDETLRRKVALKAIGARARQETQAKARFLREARVLSQLRHPHICQIYDYVEEAEGDYLVLEFIEGRNLRQALEGGIDKPLKLRLAEDIVEVLRVAHEKGLVHRDLKPSNVMLTPTNEVKVLDFGLSRFVEAGLRERALRQEPVGEPQPSAGPASDASKDRTLTLGSEIPETSIPEAEEGIPRPLQTKRGTVMGTPLYMSPEQARGESVTFASDMFSYGLLLQEIFTGEAPYDEREETTVLLRKVAAGETRPVVGLSSDLTALINRLKSPAPANRPTAVETAERLRRIREKPRRRAQRLAAAALVAVLVGGGFKYTMDLRRERRLAVQARDEASTVVDFLVNLFEVSDPGEARGNSITAREVLDKGARMIEQGLEKQPLTKARMMDSIGAVYQKLGLYKAAEPLLRKALEIRETELGPASPGVADSLHSLALLFDSQGKFAEVEKLEQRSLDIRRDSLAQDDPALAENYHELGRSRYQQGDFKAAEDFLKRALALREKAFGPDHPAVAETLYGLGVLNYTDARFEEAERLYQRTLAIREAKLGLDHPDVGQSLQGLAALYYYLGRYPEAETYYRRTLALRRKTLGPNHSKVADIIFSLGILYQKQNRPGEAETAYREALEIRLRALGENHPDVASSFLGLGILLHNAEKYVEAETYLIRALAILEKATSPESPQLVETLHVLGQHYTDLREHVKAEFFHKRALAIMEKAYGPEGSRLVGSLEAVGKFYLKVGRPAEASSFFRRAATIVEKDRGADHPRRADLLTKLGQALTGEKKIQEAEKAFREANTVLDKDPKADPVTKAMANFGRAYLLHHNLSRPEEAEKLYREALNLQEKALGPDAEPTKTTRRELVELLRSLGRAAEASALEPRGLTKK